MGAVTRGGAGGGEGDEGAGCARLGGGDEQEQGAAADGEGSLTDGGDAAMATWRAARASAAVLASAAGGGAGGAGMSLAVPAAPLALLLARAARDALVPAPPVVEPPLHWTARVPLNLIHDAWIAGGWVPCLVAVLAIANWMWWRSRVRVRPSALSTVRGGADLQGGFVTPTRSRGVLVYTESPATSARRAVREALRQHATPRSAAKRAPTTPAHAGGAPSAVARLAQDLRVRVATDGATCTAGGMDGAVAAARRLASPGKHAEGALEWLAAVVHTAGDACTLACALEIIEYAQENREEALAELHDAVAEKELLGPISASTMTADAVSRVCARALAASHPFVCAAAVAAVALFDTRGDGQVHQGALRVGATPSPGKRLWAPPSPGLSSLPQSVRRGSGGHSSEAERRLQRSEFAKGRHGTLAPTPAKICFS